MKALVAYYSFSGTTEKAAKELSKFLESKGHSATVEKIIPRKGYSKLGAYILGGYQAIFKKKPRINAMKNKPAEFDLLAVLSPTWGSTCAPPVYSFVSALQPARKGQKAMAINTCGGTPGNVTKTVSQVLEGKGFKILAAFSIKEVGGLNERLANIQL